jgi:hypothetical protein
MSFREQHVSSLSSALYSKSMSKFQQPKKKRSSRRGGSSSGAGLAGSSSSSCAGSAGSFAGGGSPAIPAGGSLGSTGAAALGKSQVRDRVRSRALVELVHEQLGTVSAASSVAAQLHGMLHDESRHQVSSSRVAMDPPRSTSRSLSLHDSHQGMFLSTRATGTPDASAAALLAFAPGPLPEADVVAAGNRLKHSHVRRMRFAAATQARAAAEAARVAAEAAVRSAYAPFFAASVAAAAAQAALACVERLATELAVNRVRCERKNVRLLEQCVREMAEAKAGEPVDDDASLDVFERESRLPPTRMRPRARAGLGWDSGFAGEDDVDGDGDGDADGDGDGDGDEEVANDAASPVAGGAELGPRETNAGADAGTRAGSGAGSGDGPRSRADKKLPLKPPPAAAFKEGQRIEANYQDNGRWFKATVMKVREGLSPR